MSLRLHHERLRKRDARIRVAQIEPRAGAARRANHVASRQRPLDRVLVMFADWWPSTPLPGRHLTKTSAK